jgi:hypothetical protein
MNTKSVSIHASNTIKWHVRYAQAIKDGLYRHGINANITPSRKRQSDVSVLMGPNLFQGIEKDEDDFIILNRKFLGFEERDQHDVVAISWNGFNGMGIFCVDQNQTSQERLNKFLNPRHVENWSLNHEKYLLCHQYDTGRSELYDDINKWYRKIHRMVRPDLLKIRNKTTIETVGRVEFMRSLKEDLSDVKAVFSLNSIVSVEALILGKVVITDDETNPCFSIAKNYDEFDRNSFLKYLAHCQWHIDEIRNGSFFENMTFGPSGPRLHQFKL